MASLTRSARLLRTLIVATCVFPLVQACGRSEPGDYLYNSDGTISEAGTPSVGGDAVTAGGTRTTGGTTGRSGSGTGGTRIGTGGTGVTTGGSSVGGTGVTTGGTGVTTGGTSVGGTGVGGTGIGGTGVAGSGQAGTGAGGSPGNPITCGADVCDSATQSCCVGLAGALCIKKTAACGGAVLGCTLNSDCPGNDVCCISITGDVSAASNCKASCDLGSPGRDRQLCQTANECPPGRPFCTATIFGVSVCTRNP